MASSTHSHETEVVVDIVHSPSDGSVKLKCPMCEFIPQQPLQQQQQQQLSFRLPQSQFGTQRIDLDNTASVQSQSYQSTKYQKMQYSFGGMIKSVRNLLPLFHWLQWDSIAPTIYMGNSLMGAGEEFIELLEYKSKHSGVYMRDPSSSSLFGCKPVTIVLTRAASRSQKTMEDAIQDHSHINGPSQYCLHCIVL